MAQTIFPYSKATSPPRMRVRSADRKADRLAWPLFVPFNVENWTIGVFDIDEATLGQLLLQ
jgi:hypothetical protein